MNHQCKEGIHNPVLANGIPVCADCGFSLQPPSTESEGSVCSAGAGLLGHIVKEDEKWALLAGANIFDASESADWPIDQLAKRINRTRQQTVAFMHQNGWHLVRVKTTHKIVATTQLLITDVA